MIALTNPRSAASSSATPGEVPIRVMHVLYRLSAGGMEYGVVKLVNGLDKARISSSICSTTPAGALKALLSPDVRLYECRRREGNDPSLIWQLYRVFRQERPDIVHTHAWGTLIEGLIAARLARVPVIVHGEHGTLQLRAYQRWCQRQAWKRVDQVLSVSSRLAERITAETGLPLARIRVIRNGVDLSRFQHVDRIAARRALGVAADHLVIGTAGRLVPVKDHANLLNAWARLAANGLEFTGVIAGDGPLRSELAQQAASLGVAERVRFLGHRPDVERVFAALDIFVLPSRSEGLSNTILEAMATGLPVVATAVGGADELVEHRVTGLLVPCESPEPLAAALRVLGTDPNLRRRMGAAGRLRAFTSFALDRMLHEYLSLYRSFAGSPSDFTVSTAKRELEAERAVEVT